MIDKIVNGKLIVFLAFVASLAALYISFTSNFVLTYNDAASHLNIARRVIDNLTPGVAQIGTVWLPLPHILMLPFAINDSLWHTGLAGSIVSMGAYLLCILFTFRFIHLVTNNRIGALIGALVMALNPNLLYLQTTPMTEPLLLAMIMMGIYFVGKYFKTKEIQDVIFGGVFVAFATLIRYDGWFLFISLLVLLPIAVFAWHGRKRAEGALILFSFSAGFGIFLWVLWNWSIFGDPMYFMTGPYSAYAQQRVLKSVGQLPTEGNVYNAAFYYFWAMVNNNGMILLLSSFVGMILVPFILKQKKYLIIILAVFSPIVFNVIALYLGQSAMNVPEAPHDPGMFNIRYGLMALPAIAVVMGIIASQKYLRFLVIMIVVLQSYVFFKAGMPVSLADGLHGLHNTYYTVEASEWLRENYEGGLILTSLASHDAFVNRAQIPMKNYVHEGTRVYWENALRGPGPNIEYIATLSFPPDLVYKSIHDNAEFKTNYKQVHAYGKFGIYKRIH